MRCRFLSKTHPGSGAGVVDAATISGYVGIHMLRKDVPMRLLMRGASFGTAGENAPTFTTPGEAYILREFSTQPLPVAESSVDSYGMREFSLQFGTVGKAAALDVFTARFTRDTNAGKAEPWHGLMKIIGVPTEILLLDLLVPRGWTDPATVRTTTHGSPLMVESLPKRVPEFELPMKETAIYLGSDLASLESPDVPRYPEVVRHVLTELGWDRTEFDLFRVRVQYPVMHTLVHLRVDTVTT